MEYNGDVGIEDYFPPKLPPKHPHYYGDVVRRLYLFACVVLLVAMPLYSDLYPFGSLVAIVIVFALVLLASFLSPRRRWVVLADTVASAIAFLIFSYFAFASYRGDIEFGIPFIVRQALAITFLFALYYSGKTFRSSYFSERGVNSSPPERIS